MTPFWTWYVIFLVVLNIVGCVWLLWWTARRRPGDPAPDETSHIWDGDLTEYNKPLPRWWINMFYLTIVFAVAYLAWFGGMGGFSGYSEWTSVGEHAADKAKQDAKMEATFLPFANQPIDQLARDPEALALGQSIFTNKCAACHGSSGKGAIGYPNLTDDNWQWGGTPDKILESILEGRQAVMPEWGTMLTSSGGPQAVDYTVAYVRTLAHPESLNNNYMAAQGKKLFEGVCVACHGIDGKGNPDLGAPNLTDDYWLYGNSKEALTAAIMKGRQGVMPAHRELLGETRSRLAAAYVWSLSHPTANAAAASKVQ